MSLPDALRPSHAYVPGQNARHPEDWFDRIKSSVMPDVAVQDTQAWQIGLAYLQAGYFWECHEVLEAVWLSLPDPSAERDMTQAIIQLANARLKVKMNRPKATFRLCDIVDELLRSHSGSILGIPVDDVTRWTNELRVRLE